MREPQRLSLKQWAIIMRNLEENDEEVEVTWLDNGKGSEDNNEWCLHFGDEMFESGFASEEEAQKRLNEIQEQLEETEGQ